MIELGPPPLILPSHYEARRPAIIRLEPDPARHFPQLRDDGPARQAMLPGMIPVIAGGGPRLTYIGTNSSAADLVTYDWGNFNIPRAGLLIVGVAGKRADNNFGQVSSITINGTVVSGVSLLARSAINAGRTAFAAVAVAAGSRNVQCSFTNGMYRAGCAVWLAEQLNSNSPVAADSLSPNDNTLATDISLTLTVNTGGFATYIMTRNGLASSSWSSAVMRVDDTFSGEGFYSVADWRQPGASGSHLETVSFANNSSRVISGVSWR